MSDKIFNPIFILAICVLFLSSCSEDPPPAEVLTTADKFAALPKLQQDAINYFGEIALGFEIGSASEITRKWASPIKITFSGERPDYLLNELTVIIEELNGLMTDGTTIEIAEEGETSNVSIFFGSGVEYALLNPSASNFVSNNRGLFFVNWNGTQNLINADMYVDIELIEEVFQLHLLREEFTQSLGLAKDSGRYPNSIFQSSWTDVTTFTDIDRELIKYLYRPEITSGLSRQEARRLLVDILYDEL